MADSKEGSGKLHPSQETVFSPSNWFPTIGVYGHYRLGIMMAKHKHEEEGNDAPGLTGEHPMTVAYSNVDLDIVNRARKLCGYEPATLSASGSHEHESTHKISPVNTTPHKHPRRPWEQREKR